MEFIEKIYGLNSVPASVREERSLQKYISPKSLRTLLWETAINRKQQKFIVIFHGPDNKTSICYRKAKASEKLNEAIEQMVAADDAYEEAELHETQCLIDLEAARKEVSNAENSLNDYYKSLPWWSRWLPSSF